MKQVLSSSKIADVATNTHPIPDHERHFAALKALTPLQPLSTPQACKTDTRFAYTYYPLAATPKPLLELVTMAKSNIYDVNPYGCAVHFGVYTRKASTAIPPPSRDVIHRFLMNFGESELYTLMPNAQASTHIKDLVTSQIGEREANKAFSGTLPKRALPLGAGTVINLGPSVVSDYHLNVSASPRRLLLRGGKQVPQLRRASYYRITVVIDFFGTPEQLDTVLNASTTLVTQLPLGQLPQLFKTPPAAKSEHTLSKEEQAELDALLK